MPIDPLNPIGDLLDLYAVSNSTNRTLGSAYTYAQAQAKYPAWAGWCAWAGYTQAEFLQMDELSTAANDFWWASNTVMSQMPWPGALPSGSYDAGGTGKGVVILPQGRFDLTMPLLVHNSGQILCAGKRPYFERNDAYQTTSTVLTPDYTNWVGAPATPSAAFLARMTVAIFNCKDPIRTINFGGNYGGQYCEGLKIENVFISGNRNPSGSWYDPSFSSSGIRIWDAGETSEVTNCYIEEMNDFGIESVFGTPLTLTNNSTFRCGRYGVMITGAGGGHNAARIYGPSGDDNGMALIGIQTGYSGSLAGGIINIYGAKHEALGAADYTTLTSQGIPGKGQRLFNSEAATHVLNLGIFGASTKNIGCAIDSMIRVGTAVAGTRTTVNVQQMYIYGNNAVKNLLQVGGNRYQVPSSAGFMAHSFVFTSNSGSAAGTFNDLNGFTITPNVSACTAPLAWLPWDEGSGNVNGSWDYATCNPTWSPETGVGGVIPPPNPPSPPVPTTVTVTIAPTSISLGATAQATAVVRDQFGNPIAAAGTWGIVSGPGSSISPGGVITATQVGNVTVSYTVVGIPTPGTAILAVLSIPVPPNPPSDLLYSIIFLGKNLQALPGCVPLNGAPGSGQENWRQGALAGAIFSTYSAIGGNRATNTTQKFTTPITGVRRIILKGCVVRENTLWRYLNDRAQTSNIRTFFQVGTNQAPAIGSFITNGAATDITITFNSAQTLGYLVGSSQLNTLNFSCTGIEIYSTP